MAAANEQSITQAIRTALVVLVITLLIWVAADQSVTVEEAFTLTIRPTSLRRDTYVAFAEPPFQRDVDVRIRGRRRRLDELRLWLAGRGVIEIPVDAAESDAPIEFAVRDNLLRSIGEIRRAGVVLDTAPEQVALRIDRYVEVPGIPVRVDYGELRVRDELGTETVTASIPRFVERSDAFQSNRRAIVNAAPLIGDRSPGSTFEVNARPALDLPIPLMEGAVKITPESVSIRGRVETLEVTETKGPIAIKWSIPDVVQRDFAVMAESGEFFVHIEVKGPLDRVSRLDKSDIRALVEVYARDLDSPGPGKTILREVRFLLPNEFCDCKLVSPIQQIGFRLEPRAAGATRENSSSTSG